MQETGQGMAAFPQNVVGVLLAGGRAERMGGGAKCLRPLGDRPLLAHVIERARSQVGALVLNINGDEERFREFGLPLAMDVVGGFAGPLAGILTGLEWAAREAPEATLVASFATDSPFIPEDMVARMLDAVERQGADLACAVSKGRAHPVFGLWPVRLAEDLRRALVQEGVRKVDGWTSGYSLARVEFGHRPVDPFFNVNRPGDLEEAERLLQGMTPGAHPGRLDPVS